MIAENALCVKSPAKARQTFRKDDWAETGNRRLHGACTGLHGAKESRGRNLDTPYLEAAAC
jgi:hypothetical protein